jgi:hypothetical protein
MKIDNVTEGNLYLAKETLQLQLQGDPNVIGIGVGSNSSLEVRVKQPTTKIPNSIHDFAVTIVIVGNIKGLTTPTYNEKGLLNK